MTISLDAITLPDLVKDGEFDWMPVQAQAGLSLSGSDIFRADFQAGEPIDLIGGTDFGWIARSVLLQLQALANIPGATYLLDYEGELSSVRFRHEDPPVISASPHVPRPNQVAADWYNNVRIKLSKVVTGTTTTTTTTTSTSSSTSSTASSSSTTSATSSTASTTSTQSTTSSTSSTSSTTSSTSSSSSTVSTTSSFSTTSSTVSASTTSTALPPESEWAAYFDNTYWSANIGSWDGSKWLVGAADRIDLSPVGVWASGYRPTHVRITFEGGGTIDLSIMTSGYAYIAHDTALASGVQEACTGYNADISVYNQIGAGANITNIEFAP